MRVLRVVQHRLHRRRSLGGPDREVVHPRDPALRLRGLIASSLPRCSGRTIRDPERHESEVRRGGIRRLPWNRAFVTVLVVNGVYLWMIGAVFGTLVPLFGTSDDVGLTIGGVGRARDRHGDRARVLYPAGHATDRRGRRAVLILPLAGLALTTAFGFVSTPVGFMFAMALLGVASGYSGVPPAPMLSDVTPEGLKGSAVAVFRFVGDLGFVIGPLVAGWSAQAYGFTTSFAINASRPSSRWGSCSRSARRCTAARGAARAGACSDAGRGVRGTSPRPRARLVFDRTVGGAVAVDRDAVWVRLLTPERAGVGARIKVLNRVLHVPLFTERLEVVRWEPPRRW